MDMRKLINLVEGHEDDSETTTNARKLNELFDNTNTKIEWIDSETAEFKIGNVTYRSYFGKGDAKGEYDFLFKSKNETGEISTRNTGEAGVKAISVYSCIVNIFEKFLKTHNPKLIYFIGDNGQGKGLLYERMAKFLDKRLEALGYLVEINQTKIYTSFTVIRYRGSKNIDEDVKFPLAKGMMDRARGLYAAIVCVMNPKDFILLTAPHDQVNQIYKDKFAPSVADYKKGNDPNFNKNNYGMPFLYVELETGQVKGHEGRHRAAMVAKEGGTKFPCILIFKTPTKWLVTYTEEHYNADGDFDYDAEEEKEEEFNTSAEAEAYKRKLIELNDDYNHGILYTRIRVQIEGGSTMKGSPRSDPSKWEYKAWKPEDVPPELVGQYDHSVIIPTSTMKFGLVKGYNHYR